MLFNVKLSCLKKLHILLYECFNSKLSKLQSIYTFQNVCIIIGITIGSTSLLIDISEVKAGGAEGEDIIQGFKATGITRISKINRKAAIKATDPAEIIRISKINRKAAIKATGIFIQDRLLNIFYSIIAICGYILYASQYIIERSL